MRWLPSGQEKAHLTASAVLQAAMTTLRRAVMYPLNRRTEEAELMPTKRALRELHEHMHAATQSS